MLLGFAPLKDGTWAFYDARKRIGTVRIGRNPITGIPGRRLKPIERCAMRAFLLHVIGKQLRAHSNPRIRAAGRTLQKALS